MKAAKKVQVHPGLGFLDKSRVLVRLPGGMLMPDLGRVDADRAHDSDRGGAAKRSRYSPMKGGAGTTQFAEGPFAACGSEGVQMAAGFLGGHGFADKGVTGGGIRHEFCRETRFLRRGWSYFRLALSDSCISVGSLASRTAARAVSRSAAVRDFSHCFVCSRDRNGSRVTTRPMP